MPREPNKILDDLAIARARNNVHWMELIRLAWEVAPDRAREISKKINAQDRVVVRLAEELASEPTKSPWDVSEEHIWSTPKTTTRRAVLLPGGGVLHTFAVREALALGLTPIVTDRDPNCPCAKIPGVEFHQIECYDVDHHLGLLETRESGDIIGAFCGGADTHVVVAAVHEWLENKCSWVSRKTAETCKDKLLAKQALLKAGVPTARLEIGLRCVVKPRFGSGSRGVRRYDGTKGVRIEPGHLAEELLEGPEQSVEVLLGEKSRAINIVDRHFAWVDDQPLEVGHTNPTRLPEETQIELYKLAYSAAAAVGASVGFFKIDSILTKDGPKVLECTPRLSGGYDSQLSTPLSTGRNLLRYGLQLACGLPIDERLLERQKSESVTVIHRPELAAAAVLR